MLGDLALATQGGIKLRIHLGGRMNNTIVLIPNPTYVTAHTSFV